MRIAISYPPIVNSIGQKAMVSQNRNVQYFSVPTYLLGITHAQAATALKKDGHEVYWDDGNAQLKDYQNWLGDLINFQPDVIVFETTTPIMRFMWSTINEVKLKIPKTKIIMTGYHVMRKPEETLKNSKTDIVLLSNHIDFVLRRLIKNFNPLDKLDDYNGPVESICFKNKEGKIYNSTSFKKIENVNSSEIIDRDLVDWKRYAFVEIFYKPQELMRPQLLEIVCLESVHFVDIMVQI